MRALFSPTVYGSAIVYGRSRRLYPGPISVPHRPSNHRRAGFAAGHHQGPDPTIAELLKPLGYTSGQFGKNHLGDRDEYLPTNHGFDEFFGNLYHLNAEEEPEGYYYPKESRVPEKVRPTRRHPLMGQRRTATQKIEDTGPLTTERMPTDRSRRSTTLR